MSASVALLLCQSAFIVSSEKRKDSDCESVTGLKQTAATTVGETLRAFLYGLFEADMSLPLDHIYFTHVKC